MIKLGICKMGYFKGELFDVEVPGDKAWKHSSGECISGYNVEEDFDFDEDHLVDFLIENKYSWGIDLPKSICKKLKEKEDSLSEWSKHNLDYLIKTCSYTF